MPDTDWRHHRYRLSKPERPDVVTAAVHQHIDVNLPQPKPVNNHYDEPITKPVDHYDEPITKPVDYHHYNAAGR